MLSWEVSFLRVPFLEGKPKRKQACRRGPLKQTDPWVVWQQGAHGPDFTTAELGSKEIYKFVWIETHMCLCKTLA